MTAARPVLTPSATPARRPRLRGVFHQYAFAASVPAGLLLVLLAPTARAAWAVGVYAAAVSTLLAVSAVYHRRTWSRGMRRWMRRLDHSAIFLVIAGSYTPWALLVLDGPLAEAILLVVWVGAVAGAVFSLVWIEAPKPITAAVYSAVGLPTAAATPQLLERLGPAAVALIAAAGALSAAGATVYALRRPNPAPGVVGYHEVFHLLVIGALGLLYVAVAVYALPADA